MTLRLRYALSIRNKGLQQFLGDHRVSNESLALPPPQLELDVFAHPVELHSMRKAWGGEYSELHGFPLHVERLQEGMIMHQTQRGLVLFFVPCRQGEASGDSSCGDSGDESQQHKHRSV